MEFKMPDIGEGVAEGEVVKWHVKEGDTVVEDQPLVEVMTDKATVVIPCPTAGTVQKIYVKEGTAAKVGAALVTFGENGATPATPPAAPTQKAATQPPPPRPAEPAPARNGGAAPRVQDNGRPAPAPQPVRATSDGPSGARVLAAPATRKMARDNGVDLGRVAGSGPHGRVTREDLVAYLERGQPTATAVQRGHAEPAAWDVEPAAQRNGDGTHAAAPPPKSTPARVAPPTFPEGPRPEQRVPMRGIRKRIAENMRRSKDHAAHFTFVEECDMTELVKLRTDFEELGKQRGVKLSYLPFIVKAVVTGLKEFPYLNSTYDEQAQEIVLRGYYNIGIAAATDEGLMVPVVKDCDRKSILEIASEIQRLSEGARTMQLRLEDMQGSTFTITSLGAMGGIMATPVINYPEVAILGVHKIRKRPVVKNDEIVIRDMCYLTCSFDHRIIDGHVGAQFVMRVVSMLEDPRLLMLGA